MVVISKWNINSFCIIVKKSKRLIKFLKKKSDGEVGVRGGATKQKWERYPLLGEVL